jgi:hypothetical protein
VKNTLEWAAKFINKVNSERQTSINNAKDIQENATLRREFIKCGNPDCRYREGRHGPYYVAYWKDENGKLKKKYIGKHLHQIENKIADMTK